jgi:hypothetical protein
MVRNESVKRKAEKLVKIKLKSNNNINHFQNKNSNNQKSSNKQLNSSNNNNKRNDFDRKIQELDSRIPG